MKQLMFVCLAFFLSGTSYAQEEVYFRVNQLGYLPEDTKVGIAFSKKPLRGKVQLFDVDNNTVVYQLSPQKIKTQNWGTFSHYFELDFSGITNPGRYRLQKSGTNWVSFPFQISEDVYGGYQETLLEFMRQQRCGYNPTLDMVCHSHDGRSFYGNLPDSTFLDVSGGWHDAGDQLKYLITSSYATGHMLMAFGLYPERFQDNVNALGQAGSNGIADVLDEAKWGLDWIHKLHPTPEILYHQIADDRDHRGFKIPNKDNSDYGWGENSYRPAYAATGTPQGLGIYKSEATGYANVAGRSAAAMALAARIWEKHELDPAFAEKCKIAAISLYELGRANEGYQQGNSFSAPYRYMEDTWADDMEWAAAELYKLTKEERYIEEAKAYALRTNTEDSWTVMDSASHYQKYPFINLGHFSLHQVADEEFKKTLEKYYLDGIEYTLQRAQSNPFHIGIPFIWCSNNLLTSLATQIILYEKMTGDKSFEPFLSAQRDWLFGRNPWGTSMFTGMPQGGEYPEDVHTAPYFLLGLEIPGGLIDGPIYRSIHRNLLGLTLHHPDEFAHLQNDHVVYHDDVGDYSTNEPTMDGTAGSILMMVHFSGEVGSRK